MQVEARGETNITGKRALWLVLAGIAFTSAGHYLTPAEYLLWHGIFQRLYYLPVVFAAIWFGWRGGLAAALLSGILYVPHIVFTWSHMRHYAMEQYAEIFMFLAVGCVTGILADRERRRREELEQTAAELRRVYGELRNSFERLRQADRLSAIGELAAGLAHEIRNPLASIDGAAEVLETAVLPAAAAGDAAGAVAGGRDADANATNDVWRETVAIIRKESARLNRLLTGLLDFARPRQPELSEVDVARVAARVVELLRHSAGKNIRFRIDMPAQLPPLCCDEQQLFQVILNLAINAAQAMPQGGEVLIGAAQEHDGLRIRVCDQGAGIPAEHLDRIFDPFFTTKEGGTGLGLAVVHQIVTRHGGTVTAIRNPEAGMTFTIQFPVTDRKGL